MEMSIRKNFIKIDLARYSIYISVIILSIALSFLSPAFFTANNLLNVFRQISINGIIAVGMTFVIITGGIDLSVGSILAISSVVACNYAHPDTYPLIVPVSIGLFIGLCCGAINGLIITKAGVAPFIATLGMMTIARGSTLVYTSGRPIIDLSNEFNQIGGGYILDIPIPIIILFIIVLLGWFILKYTKFGRYVYAVGGNEEAAKVSGLKTDRIKIGVYSLTGLLSGLSGVILSSRVMAGSPVVGQSYELDAIAAVVIGGTSLSGGVGRISGTILGALIIGLISNGLDLLNVSTYWQQIVKGIIIVLAVILEKSKK